MKETKTLDEAFSLLKEFNSEPFHLKHAVTVCGVMRWFAKQENLTADEVDFWSMVGLLHDLDFEQYPSEHCKKEAEILKERGYCDELIHAVESHGFGECDDVKPEGYMEKVLFATDELTGLIGAVTLMRPSKSVSDLETKSVKKKFKNEKFAAGCSRKIITQGAEMLDITLDELIEKTILAMRSCESEYQKFD